MSGKTIKVSEEAKEIYVIFFDNGGDEDSWRTENYGYTDKKENAEKIVQSLNNQLELDKERYQYLEDHWELIFNEKGRLNDSEYAKEYEHLIHKYPNYSMGDDGFFDYEILKELELD